MSTTSRRRPGDRWDSAIICLKITFTIAAGIGMWLLVWSVVGAKYHWLQSLFVPAAIVLAFGLMVLRTEQHWARPARQFSRMLELVRAGEAPIEELSQLDGGIAAIVPAIQDILRDLKQQKAVLAQLQKDMRDRVANRTHALERQLGSLQQQASRDALTGLFNRRMLDALLPVLIDRCVDDNSGLCVLMIDVDHFKPLNDTLGHAAGDKMLRDIGQIIRSGIRECDSAFRVGGDEFLIVMPSSDSDAARITAQRLITTVDGLAKPLRLALPVKLSIGVASLADLERPDAAELIKEADARLYVVKGSRGRSSRDAQRKSA